MARITITASFVIAEGIEAYYDATPLFLSEEEVQARHEAETIVPCPSCAEVSVPKGYIITCQWCGGENRGWLTQRAPRKMSLARIRRKLERDCGWLLDPANEESVDSLWILRDKADAARKAQALLAEHAL